MSASRVCPRCNHWHDTTAACQQGAALQAYVTFSSGQQALADATEAVLLARYRLRTGRGGR
jgi:hypothetical protein